MVTKTRNRLSGDRVADIVFLRESMKHDLWLISVLSCFVDTIGGLALNMGYCSPCVPVVYRSGGCVSECCFQKAGRGRTNLVHDVWLYHNIVNLA